MSTDPREDAGGFLTQRQREAVEWAGDLFLAACPGSGKTRTAAVRVGRLMRRGVPVAACSYTNVGVSAIRDVISRELGITPDARHFVGTLHGFLLRYVTYPFGHLISGTSTPMLLPDESPRWPVILIDGDARKRVPISSFRMRPDRSLRVQNLPLKLGASAEQVLESGADDALERKIEMLRKGVVTFDDAMFVALRVLKLHPDIAKAVSARFDEILVDEAQDTSELQLACLKELSDTGRLKSLTLVGDVEQSISAYTGASAQGCEALAVHRGLARIELVENHRSSQKICDVAVHFCDRFEPDKAVGPDAAHPVDPEILVYQARDPRTVVELFLSRLAELGEEASSAAILARSNGLCEEINGDALPVEVAPRPLALGRSVAAARGAGTPQKRDIGLVERLVCLATWGHDELALVDDRRLLRHVAMDLLGSTPSLETDLRAWIQESASLLDEHVKRLTESPAKRGGVVLRSSAAQEGHQAKAVFSTVPKQLRVQTVHDIKGESRTAALVVVDRTRGRRGQSSLWAQPLLGEVVAPEDAEELRIAYVALTRARRYCAVALPNDCGDEVISAFEGVGFRLHLPSA